MTPPSRWRAWLWLTLPADNRGAVLAELDREYALECGRRGPQAAARWYRAQVIRSLAPALSMRWERLMLIVEQCWQDVRYALRGLRRAKGFALVTALALGLGIGGATITFAAADAFLFKPLPFHEPGQLVHIWANDRPRGRHELRSSLPEFEAWTSSGALESAALFNYGSDELSLGAEPERIAVGRVSANVFDVLGVSPRLGRGFAPGDDQPGAARTVIVSDAFWRTRLGGRDDVLSATLRIGGVSHAVVGVMPPSFVFPLPTTQLWVPYVLDRAQYGAAEQHFQVVARLTPGIAMDAVALRLTAASATIAATEPALAGRGAAVVPLRRALNFAYDIFAIGTLVIGVASLLTLLTVSSNLAGLLLGRSIGRGREVAIRCAIGANRRRLLRQFAVESLVLGLLGGLVGAAYAAGGVRLMNRFIPDELYRAVPFQVDLRTIAVIGGLSVLASLFFGVMPALWMSRVNVSDAMRQDTGTTTTTVARLRLQSSMIVKQVALTIVLLVGAVLLARSVGALTRVSPGFDATPVLSVQTILSKSRYGTPDRQLEYITRVTDRAAAATGGRAALVDMLPLNHEADELEFDAAGPLVGQPPRPRPSAWTVSVSGSYFDVLRIPLLAGRPFVASDRLDSQPVVIINRSMADLLWPGESAIGRTVFVERGTAPLSVVGVVADTHQVDLAESGRAQMYFPLTQRPTTYLRLLTRVGGDPRGSTAAVLQAIHDVDPLLPVTEIQPLQDVVDAFLLPQRVLRLIMLVTGAFSLGLSMLGIYGVVSCFVNERRRELAIRTALGADRRALLRLITGRALRLVVRGAAVGVPLAIGAAFALRGLLFGVGAGDPWTYVWVAGLVGVVALAAALIPARRAAAIDPATAMRTS